MTGEMRRASGDAGAAGAYVDRGPSSTPEGGKGGRSERERETADARKDD